MVDTPVKSAVPLGWWWRFYFYGLQGFADEIAFTSVFNFFKTGDPKLQGHSAISSFFIYGSCSLFAEQMVYLRLKDYPRWHRYPIYLALCYIWELSSGAVLTMFDACPWDYTEYDYDFCGLITLEYAPLWLTLSILFDFMCEFMLSIRMPPGTIGAVNTKEE